MQVLGFTVKDDLMVLGTTWALPGKHPLSKLFVQAFV